ncbi:NRDE family protein [Vibrio cholerae]
MCTLSWTYHGVSHYRVYFNRDEQRTRQPATEPQAMQLEEVNCLMPLDPEGGGSWIATNEYGVTVCLLNFYQGQMPQGPLTSRGQIVKQLASSVSSQEVDRRMLALNLSHYAPFTVVSFDTRRNANETVMWTWDGQALSHHRAVAPIVSSGRFFYDALDYRTSLFADLASQSSDDTLGERFHTRHDTQRPHLSPLMAREDARTVSITTVHVSPTDKIMGYQAIDAGPLADVSPNARHYRVPTRIDLPTSIKES